MPEEAEYQSALFNSFGIPDFLEPWLDRFFETQELELIQLLGSGACPTDAIEMLAFS